MGLPQGQGSLQQNFIQPSPSTPPVNLQPSLACSTLQPNPLYGLQQMQAHKNFIEMQLLQLTSIYGQLARMVEEGERNLNAAGNTSGESDMQQQQALGAQLDGQKQLLIHIQDLINQRRQGLVHLIFDLW